MGEWCYNSYLVKYSPTIILVWLLISKRLLTGDCYSSRVTSVQLLPAHLPFTSKFYVALGFYSYGEEQRQIGGGRCTPFNRVGDDIADA